MVGMIYERRHARGSSPTPAASGSHPAFRRCSSSSPCRRSDCPGLNGFVGEFLILLAPSSATRGLAALATTGIIFAAVYMLWMYQRVVFGEVTRDAQPHRLADLTPVSGRSSCRSVRSSCGSASTRRHSPGKTETTIEALISPDPEAKHRRESLTMDTIVLPPVLLGPLAPTAGGVDAAAARCALDLLRALPREPRRWSRSRGWSGRFGDPGAGARRAARSATWSCSTTSRSSFDHHLLRRRAHRAALDGLPAAHGAESGEYWALVLFSTAGTMLLRRRRRSRSSCSSALEPVHVASLYVLAGLFNARSCPRARRR